MRTHIGKPSVFEDRDAGQCVDVRWWDPRVKNVQRFLVGLDSSVLHEVLQRHVGVTTKGGRCLEAVLAV